MNDDKEGMRAHEHLFVDLQQAPLDYQARQMALEIMVGRLIVTHAHTIKLLKEYILTQDTEAMEALAKALESPEGYVAQMVAPESVPVANDSFRLPFVNTFYRVGALTDIDFS